MAGDGAVHTGWREFGRHGAGSGKREGVSVSGAEFSPV